MATSIYTYDQQPLKIRAKLVKKHDSQVRVVNVIRMKGYSLIYFGLNPLVLYLRTSRHTGIIVWAKSWLTPYANLSLDDQTYIYRCFK